MSRECSPDDLTNSEEFDSEFAAFERNVARVRYERPGPPLPRVGQLISGKYRIEAQLGRGGMGAVFSATHSVTHRSFAIKWLLPDLSLQPDAVQRFWREARAAGKILHPNVVEVYDVEKDGEAHYILMELLHGMTLAERLRQRRRFEVTETCRVLIPVMRGLHAAHLAGVVHRDLKPQNIMLATTPHAHEEVPKVLDFGISKILPRSGEMNSAATRKGAIIGTPHYMPLEQLRGDTVDARSDVYAVGVIAYHMLSGALPFVSNNHADLVCKILGRTAQPLRERAPSVPAELARAIARAMAPEPQERFANMAEFAHALEPFADGMKFEPTLELERTSTQTPRARGEDRAIDTLLDATPLAAEAQAAVLRKMGTAKWARRIFGVTAAAVAVTGVVLARRGGVAEAPTSRKPEPAPATAASEPEPAVRAVAGAALAAPLAPTPAKAAAHSDVQVGSPPPAAAVGAAQEGTNKASPSTASSAPTLAPLTKPEPERPTAARSAARRRQAKPARASQAETARSTAPQGEPAADLETGQVPSIQREDFR